MEQTIRNKFIEARKNKDAVMKQLYESLTAKIITAQKSGQYTLPLDNSVILSIIKKEMKERQESQSFYKADSSESNDFSTQINELKSYLPEELSVESVREIIREILKSGLDNKGKIIGAVVKEVGDRFDKSKIAGLVQEVINGNNQS